MTPFPYECGMDSIGRGKVSRNAKSNHRFRKYFFWMEKEPCEGCYLKAFIALAGMGISFRKPSQGLRPPPPKAGKPDRYRGRPLLRKEGNVTPSRRSRVL
jgi:hypothetical protein